METLKRALIVDGMALLFRAYYATSYSGYIRKTGKGIPTNAVYGFVQYLFDAIKEFRPTHVICCWDLGGATFRTEMFSSYKGNREDPPEELVPQFDLVKDVVRSLGIPSYGVPGYEADDCIGTLASQISAEADVFILTGDHDMLQLITDKVSVVIMKKGRSNYQVYTPTSLWEEKQLHPSQIIDIKGLMGDTSDNYPGVRGIGEKTALKLVREYRTVEGILENLDKLSAAVRNKIDADRDMLLLSKELATIRVDVPLQCNLDDCRWNVNREMAAKMFEELEFGGLMKLIG